MKNGKKPAAEIETEARLRQQIERQALLSDVIGRLLISPEPQKIVDELCRKVMEYLDCHAFFNYLVDDEKGRLHLNACAGIPESMAREIEWLDYGTAVCGCVARDGGRIVAENIPEVQDPRTDLVRSFGIRAYACHPLLVKGGRTIGTLSFGTRSRDTFDADDLALMKTVADYVAIAMERMATQEALRRLNQELEQRVRDRTAELARSNAELERFAYVASHDLQEPLRMVASFVQLLERNLADKLGPKERQFIDFALDGTQRMSVLVRDLLDYSRVSTRAQPFKPVAMEDLMRNVLDDLQVKIRESGAEISHDPLPVVVGDETQLRRVLQNLIGNALKFHREDMPPRVHIAAEQRDGQWSFAVRDNGIGIAPEHFERIFVIFQRLHTRREYEGTGIGLAVVKRVIERHGGKIWVESEPDRGSTFRFTLPVRPATVNVG